MARSDHPADPRGLIHEAYRMEGLSAVECRAIFFDWALGATSDDLPADAAALLAHFEPLHPDHPMTDVLRESAVSPGPTQRPRRRSRRD